MLMVGFKYLLATAMRVQLLLAHSVLGSANERFFGIAIPEPFLSLLSQG